MKLLVNMFRSEPATVIAKASDAPTYKSLLRTLESVAPKAAIRIMSGGKRNHGITDAGVFVGTKNSEGAYYLVGSAAFALAMAEDFKSVAKKAKTEGKFIVWEATDDGLPGKSPVNVVAYSKWADALADFVSRGGGTAGASAAPIIKENAADLTFDGIVAKILELEPDGYGPKSDVYLNKACGTKGLEFNDASDSDDSAVTINGHLQDRMWFIVGDSSATSSLGRELGIKASTSTFFALKEDGIMGDSPVLVAEFKSDAEAAAALPGYLKKYQAGKLSQQKARGAVAKEAPVEISYDGLAAKIVELEPDGYGESADAYLNAVFGTEDLVFNAADNGADSAISIDSHRADDVWLLVATTSSAPMLARTLGVAAKDTTFVATIVGGMSGDNPSLVAKFSSSKAAAGISKYVKLYFADNITLRNVSAPVQKGPVSLDDMDIEATSGPFNVSVDAKGISAVRVNSDIAVAETDLGWLHDEIGVVDSDKIGDKLNTSKQIAQFIWRAPAKDTVRDYLYSIENVGGSNAVVVESLPDTRSNRARTRLVLVTSADVPKKIKPLMKGAKVAIFSVKVNSSGAMQGTPTRVYAARNLREGLQAMLYFVKETKAQAK